MVFSFGRGTKKGRRPEVGGLHSGKKFPFTPGAEDPDPFLGSKGNMRMSGQW
jgi:hypothetical protein